MTFFFLIVNFKEVSSSRNFYKLKLLETFKHILSIFLETYKDLQTYYFKKKFINFPKLPCIFFMDAFANFGKY
jgi:hypothetical protein